jgi:hypothetical protein
MAQEGGVVARRRWLTALALGIAAGTLVVLVAVWVSPDQTNLAIYGAFAAAVVTLTVPAVQGVWDRRLRARQGVPGREVDHIVDLLAAAVKEQWDSAAGVPGLLESELIKVRWRQPPPSRSLAVPVKAAVAPRRPGPLPGLAATGETGLQEGDAGDLFAVAGGLGSGRLVIAGEPGAGKTGAAVQFVLAALRHRENAADRDRPAIPVPVLVTAQDWDLASQTARDWLIRRMQQTYPMFAGKDGEANA